MALIETTTQLMLRDALQESTDLVQDEVYEAIERGEEADDFKKAAAVVIQGGQGAGKNIAVAQEILNEVLARPTIATIMTDTYPNLEDGAVKDFKAIMRKSGLDWDEYYKYGSKELIFTDVQRIQFRHLQHGAESGKSKRRDILYINEATKMYWKVVEPFISRTHRWVIVDFNPSEKTWANSELAVQSHAVKIIVNHTHNEMIPSAERAYILSRKHKTEWYRVFGLGEEGFYNERRILDYTLIDEVPKGVKRMPSGMDFGVYPDRTALVDIWHDKNKLYLDLRFSLNYLLPYTVAGAKDKSVAQYIDYVEHDKSVKIVCDAAGKKERDDIRKFGYTVIMSNKPKNSQVDGLKELAAFDIYITRKSTELIEAFESFNWKESKQGEILSQIEGHEPDEIAAVRYVIQTMMKVNRKGKGRSKLI